MATIVVNTTTDEQDGSVFDGDVSLRDALAVATDGDVIQFDANVFSADPNPLSNTTIFVALGQMTVTADVTIDGDTNGDGIADVTIDGGDSTGILSIQGTDTTARIDSLTLRDGNSFLGGALVGNASSDVTVTNSNLISNSGYYGAALFSYGALVVANSYFGGNSASVSGGAIASYGTSVEVVNSTFAANSAVSKGGAISAGSSSVTIGITSSTITGNQADFGGGVSGGTLTVTNSIIFGNDATSSGDNIDSGTVVSNGSNIFGTDVSGTTGDQILSVFDLSNVFESVAGVTVGGSTFDAGQVTQTTGVSPVVGIAAGGLAEDAGDSADVPSEADLGVDVDGDGTTESGPLERDGSGFDRFVGTSVDIGASENFDATWVVSTTDDVVDDDLGDGNLSLREAFLNARSGDTITFDSSVFTADDDEMSNVTIALTQGTMILSDGLDITINGDVNGDGIADVTLDGASNGGSRMFYSTPGTGLAVNSLTFVNGYSDSSSGTAIATNGELSVLNSTFANNTTAGFGGALRLYTSSTSVIANSTFVGNSSDSGGAIRNTGTATILNSTFYGNASTRTDTSDGGGAIENTSAGNLTLINSTITGNTAQVAGGGILAEGNGTLIIENSIITGNVAGGSNIADDLTSNATGPTTSNGGNVFGASDLAAAGDIVSATSASVFETTATNTVDGLTVTSGAISSNGGPTDTVLTLKTGDAIEQGVAADLPTEASLGLDVDGDGTIEFATVDVDQIGAPRVSGSEVDAGAVEFDNSLIVVTTTEDTRDGDLSDGDISWREALDLVGNGGTITFDPTVFSIDNDALSNTTINVADGREILTAKNVHFDGDLNDDGIADVTFDGTASGVEWLLNVGGVSDLTILEGLTIQNFSDSFSGGAMRTNKDLFVLNSNILNNSSENFGGAFRIYLGSDAVIANSYFGGNYATNDGGAIRASGADVTIIGTTFTGNRSLESGGAIAVADQSGVVGSMTLINSTITGNSALTSGGAIDRDTATLTLTNSIVAGNGANVSNNEINGGFTSTGSNIFGENQIGVAVGDTVLLGTTLEDVFAVVDQVNLGVPTFDAGVATDNSGRGPSVALNLNNPDNPAIDAVSAVGVSEASVGLDLNFDGDTLDTVTFNDGRGFDRSVDIPGIGPLTVDIGAYEVQFQPTRGGDYRLGTDGADTLAGLAGDDVLNGGRGNDTLIGGFNGDLGDTASYEDATSGVAVYLQFTGRNVGGGQGVDTLTGIENLRGSDFNDRLIGDAGNNILTGGGGNDIMKGKGGSDTFFGGDGDDRMVGSSGDDTMFGGAGTDILFALAGLDVLDGGADRDFLYGGRDNDTVHGGSGDDELRGNIGNDMLFGEDGEDDLRGGTNDDMLEGGADRDFLFGENGSDILHGGAGNDVLTGGFGSGVLDGLQDIFVFADSASGSGGFDRVKDFEDGLDLIDLSAFGFSNFNTEVFTLTTDFTAGMRIDFASGDVLFIEGFSRTDFDASDVIL